MDGGALTIPLAALKTKIYKYNAYKIKLTPEYFWS